MAFFRKNILICSYLAIPAVLALNTPPAHAVELNELGRTQERAFEEHKERIRAMCFYNPGLKECEAMRQRLEETLETECQLEDNHYACKLRENVYLNSNEVGETGIGPAKLDKDARYNFGPWQRFKNWITGDYAETKN